MLAGVVALMLPVALSEEGSASVVAASDAGVAPLMLPVDQIFSVVLVESDPEVVALLLLVAVRGGDAEWLLGSAAGRPRPP